MIKAIIFDLGGVLFTNGTKKFVDYLSKTYGYELEELKQLLDEGVGTEYREGKISRDEFWKTVLGELDAIDIDVDRLEDQWISNYEPIEGTKELILELKKKYKVYYLSDNVRDRVEKIHNKHDFLNWFDDGIFSHEVGIRKPHPDIYQQILQKAGVEPDEAVFIDDKEVNLIPAKKLGMETILFTDPAILKQDLQKLGIL